KPIVLERGRDVRRRTADTWALWRRKTLTPESNVQFGEGGAGLFSDGKLYSQIKDPDFYGRKVMHEFVRAWAPPGVTCGSYPPIGCSLDEECLSRRSPSPSVFESNIHNR